MIMTATRIAIKMSVEKIVVVVVVEEVIVAHVAVAVTVAVTGILCPAGITVPVMVRTHGPETTADDGTITVPVEVEAVPRPPWAMPLGSVNWKVTVPPLPVPT